ncbi:putative transporter permease protein [Pedobacter sp. BAL39]|uniref:ABC transporter permease n=1 Tax=Pedobacter sp. BAL39 TaxID=391596 RepID=UPI00015592A6|nr:ABC transporter permease [Pedobacter sp. BAL39]EDM37941.1 putative transporter permease protein [Pedobacter sp. BAL39]
MLQHHFLLFYRNFKKYKSSFFINLIGLSAGLSCSILIYLWVIDETRMDQFHEKGAQLYQVLENNKTAAAINTTDGTSAPLAAALKEEFPEVEDAVMSSPTYWLAESKISIKGNNNVKARGKFAGPDFLKIFSYPVVSGDVNSMLSGLNKIVISEGLAIKLFKTNDVLGKAITWRNGDMEQENHALISGVFKDTPSASSDQFDFLVTQEMFLQTAPNYLKWGNVGPNTFLVLKKGTDVTAFNKKIRDFMLTKGQHFRTLFIRPFADGYLFNSYENGKLTGGRIEYVRLFTLIAVFILVIACINFMNLSTAKASRRMKEVGIKKVMGARRKSLMMQFMAESMMLTFLSLSIALISVEMLLPGFSNIVGKELTLDFNWTFILCLVGITVFTALISGSYPAIYLSGFNPSDALKGKLSPTAATLFTRKGLVVFQFTLSVVLIVAVLVIYKQVDYVQSKNLGFKKDNVLYFETDGRLKTAVDQALTMIKQIPGVMSASSIDRGFLGDLSFTFGDFSWEGRDPKEVIKFQRAQVNVGLLETLGIEMAAGRSFSTKFGSDTSKMIINEAGIRAMRLVNPIGKVFTLWGKDYQIIGVVKDFHFESLHQVVQPMFFKFNPEQTNRIMLKISEGKEKSTIAALQRFYENFNPGYTLDYKFLDQDYQAQYVAENRVGLLSRYFAVLAILISCLGLFGLAAFTAERKLKEIGIRKVLGASELNIIYSLSKDFTVPVVLAIVIALPISYVLTKYWLNSFAYRIELQLWYFVLAGCLALFISWLTVSMQAIKAAKTNPIKCLRQE